MLLGIGATALLHGVTSGAVAAAGVGALVTLASLAGLRKHSWIPTVYAVSGGTLLALAVLSAAGRQRITPDAGWAMLSGLALLAGATLPRRGHDACEEEEDCVCGPLVLLERSSRYVDSGILECIAGSALPALASGSWVVRGEKPEFRVTAPEISFRVRVVDEAYWSSCDEIALAIPDVRAQRKVLAHTGYILVDCSGRARDLPPGLVDRWQRCLVASLMGGNTVGLLDLHSGTFREADQTLADQLIGGIPRAQLFSRCPPPVVQVAPDDPLLAAATSEARRRWPEFVSAFRARHPEQHFSIKAPVTHGGRTEHIWIEVSAITTDYICGRLGNDPLDLGALRLGDAITIPVRTMEDWLYLLSSEPVGGFTIPVVTSARRRARQGD